MRYKVRNTARKAARQQAQHRCRRKAGIGYACRRLLLAQMHLGDTYSGLQLILETGEIGRQANGAVTLTYGDTVSRHPCQFKGLC